MKLNLMISFAAVASIGTVLVTSCDWSGGGDNNFNTSGGSMIANISGFYSGLFGGGRAVSNTSNGNINSLTVQQSGNRVDVVDNQGSKYVGNVGAPLVADVITGGNISSGALVATYQISWSGKDGVSARDIEFSGTINLVTVSDIKGNTSTKTSGSTTNNGSGSSVNDVIIVTNNVPAQQGNFGQFEPGFNQTTTTTTTTTTGKTNTASSSTTTTVTYSLTDDTTQLRLRGTWVEKGGKVSSVDAVAAGIDGNLSAVIGGP